MRCCPIDHMPINSVLPRPNKPRCRITVPRRY
jgi:hypothetical protein